MWPKLPGSETNGEPTMAGMDGVNLEPMLLKGIQKERKHDNATSAFDIKK